MSDLISREEVLNLVDAAFESGAFDGRYAYENLIDAVQNLIHPLETDCISRQAAIEAIETDCSWDMFDEFENRTRIRERIIEAIKKVPPSKPERKTGHWIMKHRTNNAVKHYTGQDEIGETHTISVLERYEVNEPYCSECGKLAGDTSQDYCCACGAKMEGAGG